MGLGVSAEEYHWDLQDRIQKAQRIAQHNVREAQERQETYYNRRARPRTFQPGDQVLVSIPTTSSKQLAMWQGPFSVIRQVGPVDYKVRKLGHRQEQQVYHVNRLKEWRTPQGWMAQEKASEGVLGPLCPGLGRAVPKEAVHLSNELNNCQRQELLAIVEEFHEVFQESPGRMVSIQHEIRMPIAKPDGSLRLCIDFRKLNALTTFDAFPMPYVSHLIERIGEVQYISTLNLAKG
ncbi:hypothetical protein Y1Q_0023303 [Alligator mississippiensis]|uniref:Integrase p58-like C-terminal domain-containing protein n=1 Tax=Alligator mississippiensis TaxID=8496 RepID=A0A151NP02_ALLMI|nr:hypothetical protein Y1Q_0023303 [Alligator mississippiensis]